MQWIDLKTCTLAYETAGSGRPLLILHGAGLDHRHMADALEPVFDGLDSWRRVYVDLPGHGRSDAPDSIRTQDDVLSALVEFAGTLLPGRPFAVIGESRGSYLARGLAHVRPRLVQGLLLIVPGGDSPEAKARRPEHRTLVRADHLRSGLRDGEAARFDRLVVQNAGILEKIRRTKVPAAGLADASLEGRIQKNFGLSFDIEKPGAPFGKPCLILSGRQDSIAGYEDTIETLENYPHATYALLDRAGHSLSWEQPEVFTALAREWLGRLAATWAE